MNILVINDDGIHAPGLWSVATALKELGQVTVVAPDRDQSGTGGAMTLMSVLRVQEIAAPVDDITAYSVQGTPADCAILGAETLVAGPIDLVVSGINQGSNLGLDVLVSGTVGGAFQGYFRNIPSIAVSVASLTDVHYDAASQTTRALARAISQNSLPSPLLLNVNLPNVPPDRIGKAEITRLGPRAFLENVELGNDGRRTHYWIRHNRPVNGPVAEGTDVWAVRNNRISITPVHVAFEGGESPHVFGALADEVTADLASGLRS